MKFSTGSSSSSLAGDSLSRKSTLCIYMELEPSPPAPPAPPLHPSERMDSGCEAMELRRELEAVRSALQQQCEEVLRQRHQLAEAQQALATGRTRARRERRLRQDQLALVLRSLVLLESRLSRENQRIAGELQRRDRALRDLRAELADLEARASFCTGCRQLLGFTSEQTNVETDPEFHSLESADSRFRNAFFRSRSYRERNSPPAFQKNTRLSKSFQLPKNEVSYNTSSSEESNGASGGQGTFVKNKQAFVRRDVFRRSRKYSGRKSSSKYSHEAEACYERGKRVNHSSSAEECVGMSYQVNNDDDDVTANQIASDIRRASLKIDQLIGEAAGKEADSASAHAESGTAHGVTRQASDEINANRKLFLNNVLSDENNDKPWYCNVSDQEQDPEEQPGVLRLQSRSPDHAVAYPGGILHAEVLSATNEVLCNKILNNNNNNNEVFHGSYTKDEQNNKEDRVSGLAGAENWYASASDAEESPADEIYKNNPVLECVNQILLQNSLDDSSNDNSKSSQTPSPKASTKRVQFSTLNSISYDEKVRPHSSHTLPRVDKRANKIVKFSLETASEHSYEVPNSAQGFQFEVQSIYSNEYEPIVTKTHEPSAPSIRGSIVKNIAADIESRSCGAPARRADTDLGPMKVFNKRKVPRTPPALPPKPKNLSAKWKAENAAKQATEPSDSDAVAANQRVADVKTRKAGQVPAVSSVEPDYCSISEINVPVVSNGKRELLLAQPSVEIHSERDPGARDCVAKVVALPRILGSISDKDIPKLPQVTEIIIPDEDERPPDDGRRYAQADAYLAKFALHALQPKEARASIQMGHTVSSILSEINQGGPRGHRLSLTELDRYDRERPHRFDDADNFHLARNFEEFKIDDDLGSVAAEEYRISDGSSDGSGSDAGTERAAPDPGESADAAGSEVADKLLQNGKLSNKPDLLSNIENVDTDLESSNSSASNSGSYSTVRCEPRGAFDLFLESSGLSAKRIHGAPKAAPKAPPKTAPRPAPAPREGKPRANTLTTNKSNEKSMTTAIKYFEPYV